MKKLFILVLLSIVTFSYNTFAGECKVTILHFNDFSGSLRPNDDKQGGGTRLAAQIGKIQADNALSGRYTIVLFGGNLISAGNPISDKFKGEAEFSYLKHTGTTALSLGDHDFDYGVATLKKNLALSDATAVAVNVLEKSTGRFLVAPTYVVPLSPSCRVGIMGFSKPGAPETKGSVSGLEFTDPIDSAEDYIEDLVDQSEIKVALSQLGSAKNSELVKKVSGFNIVLGGRNNVNSSDHCKTASGVLICETPPNGLYLGRIDVSVNGKNVTVEKTALLPINKKSGKMKDLDIFLEKYLN